MFGGSRFQVCLLRQSDGFGGGGLTPMLVLECLGQLPNPVFDRRAARREPCDQLLRDAFDLPYATLTGASPCSTEPEPKLDQLGLHCGVVGLRGSNIHLVQRLGVEGEPPLFAVGSDDADFVAHHDVGMQIRIARTRITVLESRDHQARRLYLGHSPRPDPRERSVLFQNNDRALDCPPLRSFDRAGQSPRCGCPYN